MRSAKIPYKVLNGSKMLNLWDWVVVKVGWKPAVTVDSSTGHVIQLETGSLTNVLHHETVR